MTTTVTETESEAVVRRVPLSQIELADGFNPRSGRDPERFARLVASIHADGLLSPLLVTPTEHGGFRLIAGEGRWLACGEAQIAEVPVHVIHVDDRTGGLELAMAENLARQDLDPVEEARGFQRLRDAGLTKKGIGERLGLSQKRITERLELRKLADALHPKIACGQIPPAAVKALVKLHGIHPDLPEVAAARVAAPPAQSWMEPLTWQDVIGDPVGALVTEAAGASSELPADVFDAAESYPLERFTLDEQAVAHVGELQELLGIKREQILVQFGREAVEQAVGLKAVHASKEGWHHLIVGQDVADQLAGDFLKACVVNQCEIAERRATLAASATTDVVGDEAVAVEPTEEEAKAQRRAEREADMEARRSAFAHNAELGAAVVKNLTRVKVDAAALKVLTVVDIAGQLDTIAARGARYGLPGWMTEVEQRNGKRRVEYLDKPQAAGRAREFLSLAVSPGEIAGRLLCLIAMARYADEHAVARSQRIDASLPMGSGLPWSEEVGELVDELCAERLPDHLTAPVRERASAERQARAQREQQLAAARGRLDGIEQRAHDLDDRQRTQALADIETVFGSYSADGYRLRQLIEQPDEPATDAADDEQPLAA